MSVDRWTWASLLISGTVSGLVGVLYASQSGPSLTYGQSLLLPAFAAVFLGSTQLRPGRFNVWGTVLIVFVLATGVQGLEFVTGVQWLSDMFNGVALIAAFAFAVSSQRRRAAVRRRVTANSNFQQTSEELDQRTRTTPLRQPAIWRQRREAGNAHSAHPLQSPNTSMPTRSG